MSLTQQTCVPCQGGIPPLTPEEASGFLDQVPGWELNDASDRLYCKFPFDDFVAELRTSPLAVDTAVDVTTARLAAESIDLAALAFVNKVGAVAEEEGHHPDISFGWGHADIVLFTHKIQGLHENDFIMAAKISELGQE